MRLRVLAVTLVTAAVAACDSTCHEGTCTARARKPPNWIRACATRLTSPGARQRSHPRHGRSCLSTTLAEIAHETDLDDARYDAPEAPGSNVRLRGPSLLRRDEQTLAISAMLFDGLYEYWRRASLIGRTPG